MTALYPNYRVFALILGPTLPLGSILGVDIRNMDFLEQEARGFSPVQYMFSDATSEFGYQTYVASVPFVESVRIKSDHVVVCDIYGDEPLAALGGAQRAFERLCRYLSITNLYDVRITHGERIGGYLPYMYQITKIYSLSSDGLEDPVDLSLRSGHIYLPDRPDRQDWQNEGSKSFLQDVSSFRDDVLSQALKYLYRSSVGGMQAHGQEKTALDHIKSIEVIANSISNEKSMSKKVDDMARLLGLSDEQKDQIKKFWDLRSDEITDVAHASSIDQTENYPNQFPLPSNVSYPYTGMGWITADVVLKYYEYKKRIFRVDVEQPDEYENAGVVCSTDGQFGQVNPMWESNHYFLNSRIADNVQLMKKARSCLATEIGVPESSISSKMMARENGMRVIQLTVKTT